MHKTRRARLQSVIQEELAVLVLRELKDPRIPAVTITAVELTPDASQATVYVAILGGASIEEDQAKTQIKQCLVGLTSAAGFLRRHLARALTVRHVPHLIFKEDKGIANASRVYELLKQIGGPTESQA